MLFKYDWELAKGPAGAWQRVARDAAEEDTAPGTPTNLPSATPPS